MEKVFGFRPPPDKIYNDLLAVRKIALKLKTNDTVQFLNFDYFTKRNIELNKTWVKNRKNLLIKLLKNFDTRLAKRTKILEQRLKKELDRLHAKRLKQFDQLNTKYLRCKHLLEEVNAKEKMHFDKSKKHFHLRNDVPRLKLKRERSPPTRMEITPKNDQVSGVYNVSVLDSVHTRNKKSRKAGNSTLNRTGTRA